LRDRIRAIIAFARKAFAGEQHGLFPCPLIQKLYAQAPGGIDVVRCCRTHHLLDLERGVPFLKLLVLERQHSGPGADQSVLADQHIKHHGRLRCDRDLAFGGQAVLHRPDHGTRARVGNRRVRGLRRFDSNSPASMPLIADSMSLLSSGLST
jgi:hypothetical protein